MTNNGWIKLHRKIVENVELMNDNNAFVLFTKLLLLANHKGEVGLSTRVLAKRTNLNHSTMRKALKRLVDYQMVTQSRTHRYTLVVICNWAKYQETGTPYGAQTGHRRDTDGTRLTGVPRIENKNKESDEPENDGSGYRKAQETASRFPRNKSK